MSRSGAEKNDGGRTGENPRAAGTDRTVARVKGNPSRMY